jgi:hypothetical protein
MRFSRGEVAKHRSWIVADDAANVGLAGYDVARRWG